MLAHYDLRIRGNEIRPLWRYRANALIINLQQQPGAIAVKPLAHTGELLSAEWMERMRDPHKARRCKRSICILN